MINLESFLIWLGGFIFGLVIGFFSKLFFQEIKQSPAEPTSSSSEANARVQDVEQKSGASSPFF